ncbi:hypothetical protein PVK06_023797 [Gossypium arboreum]|uniref:Uncharacterized protein n=1 Tax=Gossypium arboreum TaxID=29729 RepID=A0ABR0PCA0_GOSAR|nr:hypothetical protein PVK06_023797 [Gossypium arboreum]
MMSFMIEQIQLTYEVKTPLEDVVHDASNFNLNEKSITDNHPKSNLESQLDFGFGYEKKLNITKFVSNQINIDIDLVNATLTTNLQPKLILSKGTNMLTQLLAIEEEMPTEKVDEFISLSLNDGGKTWVDQSLCG